MLRRRLKWLCGSTLIGVSLAVLLQPRGTAQPPRSASPDEMLPAPRAVPMPPETTTQLPPANAQNPAVGITYLDTLRIAVVSNLSVAQAAARAASAGRQAAGGGSLAAEP